MSNSIIKRRTASTSKPHAAENNLQNKTVAVVISGFKISQSKQKLLGVSTLVVAILSAAAEFNIAIQYEKTLWKPLMYIAVNFLANFLLALIICYSPAGRSLKPGGVKMKEPKMGVIGVGCIAIALGLGFGLFGPCGLLTFVGLCTFIILRLP